MSLCFSKYTKSKLYFFEHHSFNEEANDISIKLYFVDIHVASVVLPLPLYPDKTTIIIFFFQFLKMKKKVMIDKFLGIGLLSLLIFEIGIVPVILASCVWIVMM